MDPTTIVLFGIAISFNDVLIGFLLCALYMLLAALLYHYWIIPAIERRYKTKIYATKSCLPSKYPSTWGRPRGNSYEISIFVVSKAMRKFINWEPSIVKNPMEGTYLYELKRINYDINKATITEIMFNLLTFMVPILVFLLAIVLTLFVSKFQRMIHH